MFDLTQFIKDKVVMRQESMFRPDIEAHAQELTDAISGKSVLVIGGAGSIGSSFVKAILPFKPRTLVVVDINENALAEQTRDLRSTKGMYIPDEFISYPMDYASPSFKHMMDKRKGFDVVANFSAHKHVRSEKDVYSIEALLRNNVINAKKLLDILKTYPPKAYFCVSTDKAANPVNIMGASKRIMEDLIFCYSEYFPVKTARFANVAFSNGSLPAGFVERLGKHQPLSAPLDVKRYFVSPEESGQICMLSCFLGNNREIFFPKLKEAQMMTFDAIAENFLKAHGYEPLYCNSDDEAKDKMQALSVTDKSYPVHFAKSDTSGEKMYEEFFTDEESVDQNRFSSLGVVTDKALPSKDKLETLITSLDNAFEDPDLEKERIVTLLEDYLGNFEHIETGKSLDSKM